MMKILILIISVFLITSNVLAQCPEITLEESGKAVVSKEFNVSQNGSDKDHILNLRASAKNTFWGTKGAESAVLTVFLDGKYNQDIILFHGTEKFNYKVVLGKTPAGKHLLEITFNRKKTAQNSGQVRIDSTKINPFLAKSKDDQRAVAYAPFLYARPETINRFSDIPLLTYYEILPTTKNSTLIRYTTIFSNEDGGTRTAALMARWGRTTDIEWVYELEIENEKIVSERFQGANHVTTDFRGTRLFGEHPAIYNVTVNNNFAYAGCSGLRTAQLPIRADLTAKSRETVMDENSWTYRIMAAEAIREGRINQQKMDANTIADLRDYVYVEVYNEPKDAAISIEAQSSNGEKYTSDAGNRLLRVDRKGFSRIAMLLPRNAQRNFPLKFSLLCHAKNETNQSGGCQKAKLLKIVTLNKGFYPQEFKILMPSRDLRIGEKADFTIRLK